MEPQLLAASLAELLASLNKDVNRLPDRTLTKYLSICHLINVNRSDNNKLDLRSTIDTTDQWRKELNDTFINNSRPRRNKYHKFDDDVVRMIFLDRLVYKCSYEHLMSKYDISKSALADMLKRRRYQWVDISDILEQVNMTEEDLKISPKRVVN